MIRCLQRFLGDESGTVIMEYGLIASIISVIAIGSMIAVGGSVTGFFSSALSGLMR